MGPIADTLRGFVSVGAETLRIAASGEGPHAFVAVDPQRLRVEAAAGASARLVVVHEKALASSLSVSLERDARLEITEVFLAEAFSETGVTQRAGSRCSLVTVQLASANASYRVDLEEPGAESSVGGAFLAGGGEHCAVRLRTNHFAPECRSDASVRGIAADGGLGEFRGLVYVAPDAQRTDACQQSRNILLGEGARIVTEPQLEIYADDVKCTHGATVGQMDAEAILYMRQRGLSRTLARRLQIEGFVGDIVRRACGEELGEALMEAVARKMERM